MDLNTLRRLASQFSEIEDSCLYAHLKLSSTLPLSAFTTEQIKVEGLTMIFLLKGTLKVKFNFEEFEVAGPSIMSFIHGTLFSLQTLSPDDEAEFYVLNYSTAFLQEINISFSAISSDIFVRHDEPYFTIQDREVSVVLRYLSMMQSVMADKFNLQISRHIMSNLTAAFVYQLLAFVYKNLGAHDSESIGPRRSGYVQDFIKLVHQYYTQERSVNFYASKLFISPKYLSLLVKEATGRSAARWIDHFVITEAKNLLRFSGKNIQQVAYALNFSNQSSFGKYFKHLTGMSPTEFQKSYEQPL